jgi:hypothetical protein
MTDQLTDDERELLEKHRAAKAKRKRTVTVRGKHDDADYEFTLDGDDAERVIARHSSLWADSESSEDEDEESEDDDDTEPAAKPARKTAAAPARRKSAYFKK